MPRPNGSLAERLKLWRNILKAPPDMEVAALIATSIKDDYALCQAMPRSGFWFNKVRQLMKVQPKQLRQILVRGREASLNAQQPRKQPTPRYDKTNSTTVLTPAGVDC